MASSISTDTAGRTANLRVQVASSDALDVRRFAVEERISTLFQIDLVALSDDPDIDFDAVVGHPARFSIAGGSRGERAWSGICSHLQQIAAVERGLSTYHVRIVPVLWLATQRRNHRIFQQLSELDAALLILGEWGVTAELKVDRGAYKKRDYRVQYGESDFAFLCRLLEDAGIAFYFEQTDDDETRLVLSDAPHTREPRAAGIPWNDQPTAADREHVTALSIGQEVRPARVTVGDHDFRRAPSFKLMASATAQATASGISHRLESYHYSPGAFLFGADRSGDSPVADDKGAARSDEAEAARLAQRRLDAERGAAKVCTFETNALDLAPGVVMRVLDHPRSDLADDKSLLIVASNLRGVFNEEWTHACEARAADIPFRPPLSTPKPRASGVESATVVGPAGEEIHCDEFGRVRVHFHWDREGRMDDTSSCWIHVSQPWSGGGFGGINLPRVGQEVLIEFLGGDPDRPVIVGRLYNNLQKVPYKLPDKKTQSGWRSQSTNKTGGYNELMFEDAAGRELVHMQAERDLTKLVKRNEAVAIGHDRTQVVKNDEAVTIGHDRTKVVKNDETSVVEHDRRRLVKNNESVTIERDREKTVRNDEAITIGHDRRKTVQNDESVTVGHNRTKVVENDESVTVGKDRTQVVKHNEDINIGKSLSKVVNASEREVTGLNRTVTVGVNRSTQVGMIDSTTVGDTFVVSVSKPGESGIPSVTSELLKDGMIVLDTGQGATIKMDKDTITLTAKQILIKGEVSVEVTSPEKIKVAGDKGLTIESSSGEVIVKGGPMIRLNPDS